MSQEERFDQWAVLELFGHNRLAGRVTESTIGGSSFIRLDVPGQNGDILWTRFYNPAAVYSICPVSKEVALKVASHAIAPPVYRWELKQLPSPAEEERADTGEE